MPFLKYKWLYCVFEGAVEIFTQKHTNNESVNERKIKELEDILKKRDKIITEFVTENIDLKKLRWKNLTGEWVEPDIRDEIYEYVEQIQSKCSLTKQDVISIIGISRSKYYHKTIKT